MTAGRASDPSRPTDDPATLPNPLEIIPFDGPIDATVTLPGSKSVTNRALLCAALADGDTTLAGMLWSDDTEAMVEGLRTLGVPIDGEPGAAEVVVHGTGGYLDAGPRAIDARLSGTTARFLATGFALGDGVYRLDAEPPMRRRPMRASFDVLRQLGASVRPVGGGDGGELPVEVTVPRTIPDRPKVEMPADGTSQSVSGALLIGPCLDVGLVVDLTTSAVSEPYIALTIDVMAAFGASVSRVGSSYVVAPGGYRSPSGGRYPIPPDASAASYVFGAAAVCGGRVRVPDLGPSSAQGDVHFVDILEEMGAEVTRSASHNALEVSVRGPLRGVDVDLGTMSDTAQTLAVLAVFADTPTRIRGIDFIRRKETDRIGAVVTELRRLGIAAEEEADGLIVHPGRPAPGLVRTYDDHRMAMSFALLGLAAPGIQIADPACVAKTFPSYFTVLESLRPTASQTGRGL
ncbi:MAG: 3-phosphoshikimate 1-carboxyvinyltransferase [Acidimicrobiales bacterium]